MLLLLVLRLVVNPLLLLHRLLLLALRLVVNPLLLLALRLVVNPLLLLRLLLVVGKALLAELAVPPQATPLSVKLVGFTPGALLCVKPKLTVPLAGRLPL
jgi:hypothetical protein